MTNWIEVLLSGGAIAALVSAVGHWVRKHGDKIGEQAVHQKVQDAVVEKVVEQQAKIVDAMLDRLVNGDRNGGPSLTKVQGDIGSIKTQVEAMADQLNNLGCQQTPPRCPLEGITKPRAVAVRLMGDNNG